MRILMVNKFLSPNGGSETYMFSLGKYFESLGNEVQYFGMDDENRCVSNRVEMYTSNMDFHGGSLFSKITYPIKTIYSIEARNKIKVVLEDFKPDVVHLNNFNYQLTPSVILEIVKWREKNKLKCKIIYTAHDYQLICPNHMLFNPSTARICELCIKNGGIECAKNKCIHNSLAKSIIGALEHCFWKFYKVYRYIDVIICPSNFVKDRMDSNPIFKYKTKTIYNFIRDIMPNDDADVCLPQKFVLYFGRFSKEKGIQTLLNACDRLEYVQFVFVGSGPLEEEINKRKNIINLGFMKGSNLLKVLNCATVCVCPSEWNEPFGLTIGEAMKSGTPVVGSNVGGLSELISNNGNGYLYNAGDVNGLVSVIGKLWDDDELVSALSQNAINTKWLTVEDYANELIKIYKEN